MTTRKRVSTRRLSTTVCIFLIQNPANTNSSTRELTKTFAPVEYGFSVWRILLFFPLQKRWQNFGWNWKLFCHFYLIMMKPSMQSGISTFTVILCYVCDIITNKDIFYYLGSIWWLCLRCYLKVSILLSNNYIKSDLLLVEIHLFLKDNITPV